MLNGLCQSMITGIVPGNRNADNVDPALRKFEHIVFNSKTIHTHELKAGLLKSFGFGQAGAEILIIHPNYLLAALDEVHLFLLFFCLLTHSKISSEHQRFFAYSFFCTLQYFLASNISKYKQI
jgi:hypothetical protein